MQSKVGVNCEERVYDGRDGKGENRLKRGHANHLAEEGAPNHFSNV